MINTGDNLAHDEMQCRTCWAAFGRLLDRPGVYVWGANDYYAPIVQEPAARICKVRAEAIGFPSAPCLGKILAVASRRPGGST